MTDIRGNSHSGFTNPPPPELRLSYNWVLVEPGAVRGVGGTALDISSRRIMLKQEANGINGQSMTHIQYLWSMGTMWPSSGARNELSGLSLRHIHRSTAFRGMFHPT
ncbi:hypothetical protein CCR75_003677 [Bremia lactucae]|uniref:Uncharacterized protein n=1 Tax=Bremia lactucae TaxID=4779 RepID=A0A976IIQ4_BRELC|nr:hypothetical protein CCR75_003677 [Bremia lactucae]